MAIGKYIKAIGENLIKITEEMDTQSEREMETPKIPSGKKRTSAKPVNASISDMIAESEENKGSDEKTPSKAPSKADVRKLLAKKSSEGLKEAVAKLLKKYGEGNLSSVPEENYAKLMSEAEAIGEDDEDTGDTGEEDSDAG